MQQKFAVVVEKFTLKESQIVDGKKKFVPCINIITVCV